MEPVPPNPPDEALDAVAAAWAAAQAIDEAGGEIHLLTDPGTGQLVVEVRDADGVVRRSAPASSLLDPWTEPPL